MATKKINELTTLEECYEELQKDGVTLQSKYNFTYKNKTIYTTLGRIWFNLLLPKNYGEFIERPLDKKGLEKVTFKIFEDNSAEDAAKILTEMQKEAFKLATYNPITFSKDSFIVPDKIQKMKEAAFTDNTKLEEYGDLKSKITDEFLNQSKDESLKSLIACKATGKMNHDGIGMWVVSKGPIMDIENNISKPIKNALIDGYNGEEYYLGASEARRGYYIRGVGTSVPGSLARHIVFSLSNIKLSSKDCKTKHYLDIFVKESMIPLLIGRWYLDQKTNKLVQITDKSKIANTMIKLRSPIYCQDKNGLCETCFGSTPDHLGTDKIGIIIGHIFNKVGVQGFSMNARHASSSVNLKKCDFTKDIIKVN